MNFQLIVLSTVIALNFGYNDVQPKTSYNVLHEWKKLEFGFANDADKQAAEACGNLKPENAIPIDVQPHYQDNKLLRTFVTIPRFQAGVPYSLATVSDEKCANGPVLQPYPNYESNNNKNGSNCDAITSAFRVTINECNQMWVIDSGNVDSDSQCPPQLVVFDLKTDEVVHRFKFSKSVYTPGASLLINPAIHVKNPAPEGDCSEAMVYVADVNHHGLIVHDFKKDEAWRIDNEFLHPEAANGHHTVAGVSFELMDGIFGVVTDKKNLYFHALASKTEYVVPLSVIDKREDFVRDPGNKKGEFKKFGERNSPCAASALDSKNNLYCVNLNPCEVHVWNVDSMESKTIDVDPKVIEFVSGMKVARNENGKEELWMISNRYQKMATGTQDFSEVNFRILTVPLEN